MIDLLMIYEIRSNNYNLIKKEHMSKL